MSDYERVVSTMITNDDAMQTTRRYICGDAYQCLRSEIILDGLLGGKPPPPTLFYKKVPS